MDTENGPDRPDDDLPLDPDVYPADRVPGRPPVAAVVAEVLRERWRVLLAIAAGGGVGAAARYGVSTVAPYRSGGFPWGTFLVNVTGCLALGVLMVLLVEVWPSSRYLRPVAGVGVLGGYTTFSTYALESRELLATGHLGTAAAYLAASVLLGVLAAAGGVVLTRRVLGDRASGAPT